MSLKEAPNNFRKIIGKVMRFHQLGDLYEHVSFDVINNLTGVILFGTLFMYRVLRE